MRRLRPWLLLLPLTVLLARAEPGTPDPWRHERLGTASPQNWAGSWTADDRAGHLAVVVRQPGGRVRLECCGQPGPVFDELLAWSGDPPGERREEIVGQSVSSSEKARHEVYDVGLGRPLHLGRRANHYWVAAGRRRHGPYLEHPRILGKWVFGERRRILWEGRGAAGWYLGVDDRAHGPYAAPILAVDSEDYTTRLAVHPVTGSVLHVGCRAGHEVVCRDGDELARYDEVVRVAWFEATADWVPVVEARRDGWSWVWWDGHEFGPYTAVTWPAFEGWSHFPRHRRYELRAELGGWQWLLAAGREWGPWQEVTFSAEQSRENPRLPLAFGARGQGAWWVVMADRVHGPYQALAKGHPVETWGGSALAWAGQRAAGWYWVINGREEGPFAGVHPDERPVLHPRGGHTYPVRVGAGWRIASQGVPGADTFDAVASATARDDSHYYAVQQGDQLRLWVPGFLSPPFTDLGVQRLSAEGVPSYEGWHLMTRWSLAVHHPMFIARWQATVPWLRRDVGIGKLPHFEVVAMHGAEALGRMTGDGYGLVECYIEWRQDGARAVLVRRAGDQAREPLALDDGRRRYLPPELLYVSFSPDDGRVRYYARSPAVKAGGDEPKWSWYVDHQPVAHFDQVIPVAEASDHNNAARPPLSLAQRAGRWHLRWGDEEVPLAGAADQALASEGGLAGFDSLSRRGRVVVRWDFTTGDAQGLQPARQAYLLVENVVYGPFDSVDLYVRQHPATGRWACLVTRAGYEHVLADGVLSPGYDQVAMPGEDTAWAAADGALSFVALHQQRVYRVTATLPAPPPPLFRGPLPSSY